MEKLILSEKLTDARNELRTAPTKAVHVREALRALIAILEFKHAQ